MAPELELFIEEEVSSGRFPNRDAFIAYAIRLVQMEREDAIAGVQIGMEESKAGLGQSVSEAFADIRRAVQQSVAK